MAIRRSLYPIKEGFIAKDNCNYNQTQTTGLILLYAVCSVPIWLIK